MRTKKPIHLAELQFVYDLASTDSYFEIWITHVENKRRNDLFYERVNIAANKRDGEYLRMFFPKGKINLHPGKQIVIRIEFAQEEYRMTLDNCKVSMASARDALELCQSKELPQIISKIVYLD